MVVLGLISSIQSGKNEIIKYYTSTQGFTELSLNKEHSFVSMTELCDFVTSNRERIT